jgi:UDPglucose 6-dehydrogenase
MERRPQGVIGIAGLSHLGLVTGIGIASKGFDVVGFDPDARLVGELRKGKLPVFEPGLDDLLKGAPVTFTDSEAELGRCDVIYVALDVKTDGEGRSDLAPLNALIERIVPSLKSGTTLVIHSQVPPGFTRKRIAGARSRGLNLVQQVETLVFGRAVERVLKPERYIVGCEDPTKELAAPYAKLLAAFGCPVLKVRYESAELAKISINMVLISSVSVTNMLAELCEKIGADWREIAPALRLDARIGPHAYLSPGLGLSGGNLERDLATVASLGAETGAEIGLARGLQQDSLYRRGWVLRKLREATLAGATRPTVALWGLTYKPDTKSTKNSPSLGLLEDLAREPGAVKVAAYDPQAEATLGAGATRAKSALDACRGADALVIMTPWKEFSTISADDLDSALKGRVIIDPLGALASMERELAGKFRYFTLGKPEVPSC